MTRFRPLALCAAVIAFASCAAPRIDGSSVEKANESIRAVRHSVGADREKEFDRALLYVMSDGGQVAMPAIGDPAVRRRIDGKTADEVMAAAAKLHEEAQKRAHEQEVQQQLAEVKSSFLRIDAKNPKVTITHDPEPEMVDPNSENAIWSKTPLTNDPFIVQYCDQRSDDYVLKRQCEQDELKSKNALRRTLMPGVSPQVGAKIRAYCAQKSQFSYRGRLACEADTARMILVIQFNPEAAKGLPPDIRDDLEKLMR